MRLFVFAFLALVGLSLPVKAAMTEDKPVAVLRALDKITARVEELDLKVDEPLRFGTLTITVKACKASPPEDPPESAAFIQVVDQRPSEPEKTVFSGWMFSSSPSLSAMEHPIYDLWVTGCKNEATK